MIKGIELALLEGACACAWFVRVEVQLSEGEPSADCGGSTKNMFCFCIFHFACGTIGLSGGHLKNSAFGVLGFREEKAKKKAHGEQNKT